MHLKAILKFDFNKPFERNAHTRAIKGTDCYIAFHSILEDLRSTLKYGPSIELAELINKCPDDVGLDIVENIRDMILAELEERNINLDDLE
jgi:hypothetical protein